MSYFLAASLVTLRNEVNALWPNRSKVSDGWIGDAAHSARKSDHNPDWGAPGRRRGVVRALDITTRGIDVDRLLRHTTNDSRVAYVIYNRRIYTHRRGWYRYTGPNPHTNHVHISIAHTNTAENDTKTWISSVSTSTTKPASGGGSSSGSGSSTSSSGTVTAPPTRYARRRTIRDDVPIRSHRDHKDDSNIVGYASTKGYRLNVVENPKGSWTRVRWEDDGEYGNHWVSSSHIEDGEWPEVDVIYSDTHTTESHNAWVEIMSRPPVNRTDQNLTINIQRWLRDLGYLKQSQVSGVFDATTVSALQTFLKDKGLYTGVIDGKREAWTVQAEIAYLNDQRQYYK